VGVGKVFQFLVAHTLSAAQWGKTTENKVIFSGSGRQNRRK
jgi:hypothetical protein